MNDRWKIHGHLRELKRVTQMKIESVEVLIVLELTGLPP